MYCSKLFKEIERFFMRKHIVGMFVVDQNFNVCTVALLAWRSMCFEFMIDTFNLSIGCLNIFN